MLDETPCPACGKMITEEDVVQDVAWDDAFAYADVYFNCPHCGIRLKVHAVTSWSFSIPEEDLRSMDIVKFAEEVMGLELYAFQKKILEDYKEGGRALVIKRRPGGRTLERIIKEYEVWSIAKAPS